MLWKYDFCLQHVLNFYLGILYFVLKFKHLTPAVSYSKAFNVSKWLQSLNTVAACSLDKIGSRPSNQAHKRYRKLKINAGRKVTTTECTQQSWEVWGMQEAWFGLHYRCPFFVFCQVGKMMSPPLVLLPYQLHRRCFLSSLSPCASLQPLGLQFLLWLLSVCGTSRDDSWTKPDARRKLRFFFVLIFLVIPVEKATLVGANYPFLCSCSCSCRFFLPG